MTKKIQSNTQQKFDYPILFIAVIPTASTGELQIYCNAAKPSVTYSAHIRNTLNNGGQDNNKVTKNLKQGTPNPSDTLVSSASESRPSGATKQDTKRTSNSGRLNDQDQTKAKNVTQAQPKVMKFMATGCYGQILNLRCPRRSIIRVTSDVFGVGEGER